MNSCCGAPPRHAPRPRLQRRLRAARPAFFAARGSARRAPTHDDALLFFVFPSSLPRRSRVRRSRGAPPLLPHHKGTLTRVRAASTEQRKQKKCVTWRHFLSPLPSSQKRSSLAPLLLRAPPLPACAAPRPRRRGRRGGVACA
jgi:hypothetical protein